MRRNRIIIVLVIVIIILGIAGWFLFGAAKSNSGTTTPNIPQSGTSTQALAPVYNAPTSSMVSLGTPNGTVTMSNFYRSALGADDEFIVLAENDTYEITYDTTTNSFYIYIEQAPFAANRLVAEADFLKLLEISQSDACKLSVGEGSFQGSSVAGNGNSLGLSFCTGGVFQAK